MIIGSTKPSQHKHLTFLLRYVNTQISHYPHIVLRVKVDLQTNAPFCWMFPDPLRCVCVCTCPLWAPLYLHLYLQYVFVQCGCCKSATPLQKRGCRTGASTVCYLRMLESGLEIIPLLSPFSLPPCPPPPPLILCDILAMGTHGCVTMACSFHGEMIGSLHRGRYRYQGRSRGWGRSENTGPLIDSECSRDTPLKG